MRCHQCYRIATAATCSHCGTIASLPLPHGVEGEGDAGEALFAALARGQTHPEDLWDLLCLACVDVGECLPVDDRLAELALTDLGPVGHCILGTWIVRRTIKPVLAAPHFATAVDNSDGAEIAAGPASFVFLPHEASLGIEIWLHVNHQSELLGVLNREGTDWLSCNSGFSSKLLAPISWSEWKVSVERYHAAVTATWQACFPEQSSVNVDGTEFRQQWKEFQLLLGERRDGLRTLDEQNALTDSLRKRDRDAIRSLDVNRRILQVVDGARDDLRQCAESVVIKTHEGALSEARKAYEHAFIRGGYQEVAAIRDEVRRSYARAHAELRKGLEYESRLLRGAQEALHATLAEISRRANGWCWRLTPQSLLEEARELALLLLERAREVAMIEETSRFLELLNRDLESAGSSLLAELQDRRIQLDSLRHGLERVADRLGIDPQSGLQSERAVFEVDSGTARRLVSEMGPGTEGMLRLMDQLGVAAGLREPALI